MNRTAPRQLNTGRRARTRCQGDRRHTPHRVGPFVPGLLAMLALAIAAAAAVNIETAVEPVDIYLGESATLTVRVSGFRDGMQPDLGRLADAGITFLGQSDQHYQNISIVNGQRQVNSFSGRLFQYRVRPTRAGPLRLGPIHVVDAGQTIATAAGPVLNARPVPAQDMVQMMLEPSKPTVILSEPFTVNLRIRIRRLPPPHAQQSPLLEQAPPFLSIPYLDRGEIDGLERENTEQRLNAMLVSGGDGFRINGFTVGGDPFANPFGRSQPARFRLDRQAVTLKDKPYFEYTLGVQFTPQREGVYPFGPVIFKGQVLTQVSPRGEGITQTIYAVAEMANVKVVPPPIEGRPPFYIGAIGSNLTVSAVLDTQTCYVGDPLTLTLEIKGDARLDAITAPRLERQLEQRNDFRIYDDTVQPERRPDARRYRYTVRTVRDGTLEFPALAVSYYDTARSAYRTVHTDPVPVRANAVTEIQDDMIIDAGGQHMTITGRGDDERARRPPAPFRMRAEPAASLPFYRTGLHSVLLLAGPLLVLATGLLRQWRRLRPAWDRVHRRRSAAATALQEIGHAARQAESAPAQRIAYALRRYMQHRHGLNIQTATPGECAQRLREAGMAPDLSTRFSRCLNACEEAAFSGRTADGNRDLDDLQHHAATLVNELENNWPPSRPAARQRHAPPSDIALLLLLLSTVAVPAVIASPLRSELAFDVQRATTAMLNASTPQDFADTADALAMLITQGAANADLFYNYGTALLMAGDPSGALDALSRAERYGGTDPDTRRNMQLARQALGGEPSASGLPWHRPPLFWHYRLPTVHRMTITATAFLLLWITALFLHSRRRDAALVAFWLSLGMVLLFGASVLSSFYAEHHATLAHAQRQPAATAFEAGEDR